ncbi:aminodeoxychorismate synthase component I [Marinobacter oulmenensis]|uniref:Para-aminobenzoate synthetase component 1 n=1 Tax=Marinobacter oulmenensis TaxID=643747 RepID=A0A840UD71_9GAMM|nr:para-aminobenzoate synthetase component 1 [Marinobacter oulmenensis]
MHSCLTELSQTEYLRLLDHAAQAPDFVFLGSAGPDGNRGALTGFSAMAVEHYRIDRDSGNGRAAIDTGHVSEKMEALRQTYAIPLSSDDGHLPGGWIGILGYELGYVREKRLASQCPKTGFPLLSAGFYTWTASHDRQSDRYWLWQHPHAPASQTPTLADWRRCPAPVAIRQWRMPEVFHPRQQPDAFKASVQAVRDYIQAGDCYQANLSQEFQGHFQGSPWRAFQALSEANPTPYSAFLRIGDQEIISVSPERFLEIRNGELFTSPIKGTRPRGDTPEQDRALAMELENAQKDRAENLMIVDLLRNDLSLNAQTGSVTVDQLFALESYRNVHHLVSHIRARLKAGVSPLKALFDAFPGGSITGAPKIRAMEIIRELEPHWRGPYCGSVFYYGVDGRLDSSIAIRTLLCGKDGSIRCWGGGGIVADSDPEAEYQETLAKVQPLMRFLETLVI